MMGARSVRVPPHHGGNQVWVLIRHAGFSRRVIAPPPIQTLSDPSPLTLSAYASDGVIRSVSVKFGKTITEADAIAAVTQAWGAPTKATMRKKDTLIWVNPEAKLRANFDQRLKSLRIEAYMPLADFLGTGDTLGFEKPLKVIGASKAALTKAYGAAYAHGGISLPVLKFGAVSNKVSLSGSDDIIDRMQVWIPFGPEKAQVMAALEARFGKAALIKGTGPYAKDRTLLGGKIEIKDQKDTFYLEFTAPKAAE